ncbi:glycoside hydrolase family 31 protein [Lacisediminihabitans sp.]|uniref:glycoside hydrolase family 31 protein n=1 Tax=Lacisediminihabitans sp. TaxID=2787631 RepID=UPI002F948DF1
MVIVAQGPSHVVLRWRDQTLRLEAWGANAVRVRVHLGREPQTPPSALLEEVAPPASGVEITESASGGLVFRNAGLVVDIQEGWSGPRLAFRRPDGTELLSEAEGSYPPGTARRFSPLGGGRYRIDQRFTAYTDEKLFGLGQHPHGSFDNKHTVTELHQWNGAVTIPFMLSSRGYGFLWNNPALGHLELAANGTRWVADASRLIDYWIVAGDSPAQILSAYADATGHSPELPEWASGYWQSKLRYETQEELLQVAREYHRRGLPLSVIVADYFHWTHLGDFRFDPEAWPDPAAMVEELNAYGTKLVVSVWPSLNPFSDHFDQMLDRGYLIRSELGMPTHHLFPDWDFGGRMQGVSFYDPTDPDARLYVWDQVREGYASLGINGWWLDASEPEISGENVPNLRLTAGPGDEVINVFPREHSRTFFEGMKRDGTEGDGIILTRSAWAGSQRYGVVLWSGDIHTNWETLNRQVRAGLNVAMSGIPWWTTDIGGFNGGDPTDPDYRELYVRWFQYGAFSPIFRAHGHREPRGEFVVGHTGGPNEIWAYGPEVEPILEAHIRLRERLRPYLHSQFRTAAETGLPIMRPVLLEFPLDDQAWLVDDAFLLGPDLLVAPVLQAGARERTVYFPAGADWTDVATGERYSGGTSHTVAAPIERIPLFTRDDAHLPITAPEAQAQ